MIPAQVQLLEAGIALQGQGQLLGAFVVDLVVAEVQLPQGAIGRQGPAKGGKGFIPCAQVVPLQGEALNGLVLSEEFCQCLGPCCSKVIALGEEEAIQSLPSVLGWALNTLVRQQVRPW